MAEGCSDEAAAGRCALISAGACTAGAQQSPLAGTSWRLVELRSADGATGTVRVDDPSRYAAAFDADRNAAFRFDCNRGRGPYTATPTGPDRGRLEFGAIASTRAMCGPGSLDMRLGREFAAVRSYVIAGAELRLELADDGGQQVWQRAVE